jgi:hypothetical protein|tara:strand:+ start:581 stop:1357 length:777 start_codon:yes stop_codon:yes gene_type:complete
MKFSKANAKIEALANHPTLSKYLEGKRKVYSFDLLSGYSCPFAEKCLSKAVLTDGKRKIKDGPKNQFRCFSASQEVQYTNVYNSRKANFDALRNMETSDQMRDAIQAVMPKNVGIVRIHVAGDFFNAKYFNAWLKIADQNPDVLFYAYTKSLKFWLHTTHEIPYNMVLTASRGGRDDNLISEYNLRESVVVYSEAEAAKLGLEIDHDDSHAADPTNRHRDFALLIHGTQPKGSEAAEALKQLKRNNVKHSYSRKAVKV